MKLSIIIINWNTVNLLIQCLESIPDPSCDSWQNDLEVLVVDNASTDNSVQHVRERFPWVKLIENNENVGFARANNQAIHQSTGKYILLLNPDTEVKPDALKNLLSFVDEFPEVGAVGPQILNPDGSLQISCYPVPTLKRELWRLLHLDAIRPYGVYQMHKWPLDQVRSVDVLLGACLLLRREVLEQVGLLDDNYFMYSEEVDLCFRVQKAGWQICWVPDAQIVHYGGQSTQQIATEMFLQLYKGKLQYFRKNHSRLAGIVYKFILLIAALGRLALTPLAWLGRPTQRRHHLTLANRYWRLVAALPGL